MDRLKCILSKKDIYPEYQDTPIGQLLEYHNLNKSYKKYSNAQLIIGTCMDHRINIRIPDNYSYLIRTAGVNLKHIDFNIAYALSVTDINNMALIAHNNCGMVGLNTNKDKIISGLINRVGWDRKVAKDYFNNYAHEFEIKDEIDFILNETKRLRNIFLKINIAPLLYNIDDQLLYQVNES